MHLSEDSWIVVGVDFSEHAHAAVDAAICLAVRFNARVRLVHALVSPGFSFRGAVWMLTPSEVSEIEARSSASLTALVQRLRAENPTVHFESTNIQAAPVQGLLTVAEQIGASLLVVGTHGRGFWSRLTLGSVAREVIHSAALPVLTVQLDPTRSAALNLAPADVLVPIDMDPESLRILDMAIGLAEDLGWGVRLLHAYPPYEGGPFGRELEVRAFREEAMRVIVEERRHRDVPIDGTCVEGSVAQAIVTAASSARPLASRSSPRSFPAANGSAAAPPGRTGLIVMATHLGGPLRQALAGSVASEVVRLAPCPVLTCASLPPAVRR